MRTSEHSARELGSRAARQRLPQRINPYYSHIKESLAIGYRQGKRGGSWIARHHDQAHGYRFHSLGAANDLAENVGLSFQQALDASQKWYAQVAAEDSGEVPIGKHTVSEIIDAYLKERERAKRRVLSRTRSTVESHIRPTFGHLEATKLAHGKLKKWRDALADSPAHSQSSPGARKQKARALDVGDPEAMRKRQATANRVMTTLKAILNYGYNEHMIASKAAWERITPFREVDVAKVRYLSVAECKRLAPACPADFGELVLAALFTGARYSELTALDASSFDPNAGTIFIARSKGGKSRFIPLNDEGRQFFATVASKAGDRPLFIHDSGRREGQAWGHSQQAFWLKKACAKARIEPAVSFHILRHTYASHLAMAGTPMAVIAALLGHADTRITEKHYGHFSPNSVATALRAGLPSFAPDPDEKPES
jgi:integrase